MNFDSMNYAKISCIIVYGENEKVYANLLLGLIGEFAEYECAIWPEKEFEQNSIQISSSTKVIFIGNTKVTQKIIPNIRIKYNNYGMKYGWLGNRGVIYVEQSSIKKDDYNAFCDFCIKVNEDFKRISNNPAENALFAIPLVILQFFPIASLPLTFHIAKKRKQQIKEQQYNVVVRDFFKNGLSQFMEE